LTPQETTKFTITIIGRKYKIKEIEDRIKGIIDINDYYSIWTESEGGQLVTKRG